jgi:hypothetical protein
VGNKIVTTRVDEDLKKNKVLYDSLNHYQNKVGHPQEGKYRKQGKESPATAQ